jgi:hypothetical protein
MARLTRMAPIVPALLAAALVLPTTAFGDAGLAVIHDCLNNGRITGHYTQQAYSQALAEMPTDVSEYSDCPNLIRQAQLAAAGHGGAGGALGGAGAAGGTAGGGTAGGGAAGAPATSFTPAEKRALASAHAAGAAPVDVGGQVVRPGVVPVNVASALNSLPTPLLAVLVALLACALAALGWEIRKRVRARRAD